MQFGRPSPNPLPRGEGYSLRRWKSSTAKAPGGTHSSLALRREGEGPRVRVAPAAPTRTQDLSAICSSGAPHPTLSHGERATPYAGSLYGQGPRWHSFFPRPPAGGRGTEGEGGPRHRLEPETSARLRVRAPLTQPSPAGRGLLPTPSIHGQGPRWHSFFPRPPAGGRGTEGEGGTRQRLEPKTSRDFPLGAPHPTLSHGERASSHADGKPATARAPGGTHSSLALRREGEGPRVRVGREGESHLVPYPPNSTRIASSAISRPPAPLKCTPSSARASTRFPFSSGRYWAKPPLGPLVTL